MKRKISRAFVISRPRKRIRLVLSNRTVVCAAFLVTGVIIGSAVIKRGETALVSSLSTILRSAVHSYNCANFFQGFCLSLCVASIPLILCFLSGMSLVGAPAVCSVLALFGTFCGVVAGVLFRSLHMKGFGFFILAFLPYLAITAAALLYAGMESIDLSLSVLAQLSGKKCRQETEKLQNFCLRYAILLGTLAAASFLQSCSFRLFGALFGIT